MVAITVLLMSYFAVRAWRLRTTAPNHGRPSTVVAVIGAVVVGLLVGFDFESQKEMAYLATPVGLVWLGLFALLANALQQLAGWQSVVLGVCWLALTIGGNQWVGAWLLGGLERSVPRPDPTAHWDAIAVLGGGTSLNEQGTPELGSAGDRLRVAAELFRADRAPLLVTTGSGMLGRDSARSLPDETAALWTGWGIPDRAIVRFPGPVNTAAEIALLSAEAKARRWHRIAIVSSAWHLPRVAALTHQHGLSADLIPAGHEGRMPPLSLLFIIPTGSGLHACHLWSTEVIGKLVGR